MLRISGTGRNTEAKRRWRSREAEAKSPEVVDGRGIKTQPHAQDHFVPHDLRHAELRHVVDRVDVEEHLAVLPIKVGASG